MISEKVTRPMRIAVLFGTLLGLAAGSTAADLASTYAHDAFPSAAAELTVAARQPCRQARLTKRSRSARKPPAAAVPHGGAAGTPEAAPAERSERPGVVAREDDSRHG
jgi:hypothetical protein